jgi:hypothetical protein
MERWGRWALQTLGYEFTTASSGPFPVGAYLKAHWSQFAWNVRQTWRLATGASLETPKVSRAASVQAGICPSSKA